MTLQYAKKWTDTIICLIYKKKENTEYKNYRDVALYKMSLIRYERYLLEDRLQNNANIIGDSQSGFRENKSVNDYILNE